MTGRKLAISILVTTVAVVVVYGVFVLTYDRPKQKQSSGPSSTLIDKQYLQDLPRKSSSGIDISHISDGLKPPTNKWFSGLALQKDPKAVFPSPLSFKASSTGYEFGLPSVKSSDKLISAPHAPQVKVTVVNADSYKVTRYDELSLDISYFAGDKPLGYVTISAGSPFIFFTSQDSSTKLRFSGSTRPDGDKLSHSADKTKGSTYYYGNVDLANSDGTVELSLSKDAYTSSYLLPDGATDSLNDIAENKLTGVQVSYSNSQTDSITRLNVATSNNQPTLLTLLPHQNTNQQSTDLSYQTLYGRAVAYKGNSFEYSTKKAQVSQQLPLENITDDQRAQLITTLRQDINATNLDLDDSYFGAKSAYRASQLLQLAVQLKQDRLVDSVKLKLSNYLNEWFTSGASVKARSFYFDPDIKGLVADMPAFGSEQFNDHHFHYGYFIYAAAVLADNDPTFLKDHKDAVNLIVADIANYNSDEEITLRRSYDPYFGHSWASGSAPFDDGNNQESVSEAINAWTATYLWGDVTGNSDLTNQSQWMLSNEVNSANKYWLGFNQSKAPYAEGYGKDIVSLNWGAKREYNTFFSAEPTSILGIQLIPMNPSFKNLYTDSKRAQINIAEAGGDGQLDKQFADYILMYGSASSGDTTGQLLKAARDIPEKQIDGANSRAYMYAWIMAKN